MKEEFITFQKFNEQVSALELGKLLKENNIEYLLEDNSVNSDPIMSNNEFSKDFRVKLQRKDFEKADNLLQQLSQAEIDEIDKNYYLFSFSDDELIDLEVLFLLAWCGNYLRSENRVVKELLQRGEGFSQHDN